MLNHSTGMSGLAVFERSETYWVRERGRANGRDGDGVGEREREGGGV